MKASSRWAVGVALFFGIVAVPAIASATPSRWSLARDKDAYPNEVTRREVEAELLAERVQLMRFPVDEPLLHNNAHTKKARLILEEADVMTKGSTFLKLRYADVLQELDLWKQAVDVYEQVVKADDLPAVLKSGALADLAIVYARLGRQEDEIEAYEAALALEPLMPSRAVMLANQAEAFMVLGDVSRAIDGYRAALESLTTLEAHRLAPTTLWSLAVATDRSGDLDNALVFIERARSYDPHDKGINGGTWFFVPSYDRFYYEALGHWLIARRSSDIEQKRAAFERTVAAWSNYLASAPEKDHYVAIAKARLAQAEREREVVEKRARTPSPSTNE